MRVTSAEFIKNYGAVSDTALKEPVTITRNGRDRLVLVAADEYERLKRRDRRAVSVEEISEEEYKLFESATMEPGHEHLDKELEGWQR